MKTVTVPILLTILIASNAFAPPGILWTQTYGGGFSDKAYCIQPTSDGGYIVTGMSASYGNAYGAVFLLKTNSDGQALWYQTFGSYYYNCGKCVQQTSDGGYIIAGHTAHIDPENFDICLIKTDEMGNETWSRTFGGDFDDHCFSVQQTSDGGYILVGYTESHNATIRDVYLIKTDAEGRELWSRIFDRGYEEEAHSVQQTSDGGYIITGFTNTYGAGWNSLGVFLLKTDERGNVLWCRTRGNLVHDRGYCVRQTTDGGYIVSGNIDSELNNYNDVYLLKTDSLGHEMWSRTFGGNLDDCGYSVRQTTDGGYIIAGNYYYPLAFGIQSDVYIIKTDQHGDESWSMTYGGGESDYGRSVQQTRDGGYIVAGYSESFGAGQNDVYLIRIDSEGEFLDSKGASSENSNSSIPDLILCQAYPNPFNQRVALDYMLPAAANVQLSVCDITGREVAKLVDGHSSLGQHEVVWDASSQASGVYFVRLEAGDFRQVRKLLLVK